MTDYFVLLGEVRRPWVDSELLKSKFLEMSGRVHPDRFHGRSADQKEAQGRAAELNAAYTCLSDAKARLLHLLQLESGSKPIAVQSVPGEMMDFSLAVGSLCRQVDEFLREQAEVTSPLLKVRGFERGQEWIERIDERLQGLTRRRRELIENLEAMNSAWTSAPPVGDPKRAEILPLRKVEELYRLFSYLDRWEGQLRERLVRLSF